MKSELDRLRLYRAALKYYIDTEYEFGFCSHFSFNESIDIDTDTFPELYKRRTRQASTTSSMWYNGRQERIAALKSSIRELRWKIWISRVSTMLCLSKRTDSTQ